MPLFLTYRGNWFYTQDKIKSPFGHSVPVCEDHLGTMVYVFSSLSYILRCPLDLQAPLFPTMEYAFLFWVCQSRISKKTSWFKTTEMYPPRVRNPKSWRQHGHAHTEGSRESFLWSLLGIPSGPVCFQSLCLHTSLLKRVPLHVYPP